MASIPSSNSSQISGTNGATPLIQALTGQNRIRRYYGKIREVLDMPNLIEVQKSSYDLFLNSGDEPEPTDGFGIQGVFQSVFPIRDFNENAILEFVSYELQPPKYDVDECQQRDMTYSAPLKVTLRLIVFDVDDDKESRSVKDIKEQDVYMGEIPLMTNNGTFVYNGTERVVVSQMHRSPGVFFDHDKGKSHSSGKLLFVSRIIPYRGSWLDLEFDAKDLVNARIDRKRKLPVTTLLYALGMDQEDICDKFYNTVTYRFIEEKNCWAAPFFPRRIQGTKPAFDMVDATSGEIIAPKGDKVTPRTVRKLLSTDAVTEIFYPFNSISGRYSAKDIIDEDTGEIWVEAGDEITVETSDDGEVVGGTLKTLMDNGIIEIPTLDIDHVNTGAYIRNTMATDKNHNQETALEDIYRVLRPGEPPTPEAASSLFRSLFFDPERYDLSAVGRAKMNLRLDLDADDAVRTLRKEDIVGVVRALVELRDGKGEPDDIDHLGNRRVRSVGELMENAYRLGLLRMERAIKERMSSVDIDTVMPQDLINSKPAAGAVREFFRLVPAVPVHGPDQPVVGGDPQAPAVGAGAGRADAGTSRFRGQGCPPDPLRQDMPDRNARGAEYRLDQLSGFLRQGQQVRFHRNPVPACQGQPGDRRCPVHVGDGGNAAHGGPGQCTARRRRAIHQRPGIDAEGRRVHAQRAGKHRFHRRVSETTGVRGGVADSVPRE